MANTFNPADTIIRNGWETSAPGLQALALDGYHRLGPGGWMRYLPAGSGANLSARACILGATSAAILARSFSRSASVDSRFLPSFGR